MGTEPAGCLNNARRLFRAGKQRSERLFLRSKLSPLQLRDYGLAVAGAALEAV
jgi:hypothetical protein